MPISDIDGYPKGHWGEILSILKDVAEEAGFEPNLVSDADDVGLIHKRIVQNLFDSPIVLCDLSGRNPNVMLELGMRLAFDKPTVLVKDDKTGITFDAGVIEHLLYPADLRYSQINTFRERLGDKLRATYRQSQESPDKASFLKAFGSFTVQKLDEHVVPAEAAMLEAIAEVRTEVRRLRSEVGGRTSSSPYAENQVFKSLRDVCPSIEDAILNGQPTDSSYWYRYIRDRVGRPSSVPIEQFDNRVKQAGNDFAFALFSEKRRREREQEGP